MATPPSEKVPTPFWVAPPLKSKISMPPPFGNFRKSGCPPLYLGGGRNYGVTNPIHLYLHVTYVFMKNSFLYIFESFWEYLDLGMFLHK